MQTEDRQHHDRDQKDQTVDHPDEAHVTLRDFRERLEIDDWLTGSRVGSAQQA
jgi:hypothetical protein